MISFKKAVKIAQELDACNGVVHEYTDCYIFAVPEEGLGISPCVVLKDSGEAVYMHAWAGSEESADSVYIRSFRQTEDGAWEEYIDPEFIEEE